MTSPRVRGATTCSAGEARRRGPHGGLACRTPSSQRSYSEAIADARWRMSTARAMPLAMPKLSRGVPSPRRCRAGACAGVTAATSASWPPTNRAMAARWTEAVRPGRHCTIGAATSAKPSSDAVVRGARVRPTRRLRGAVARSTPKRHSDGAKWPESGHLRGSGYRPDFRDSRVRWIENRQFAQKPERGLEPLAPALQGRCSTS